MKLRYLSPPLNKFNAILLLSLGCSNAVMASGFRIPELSTTGTGAANALVANTSDTGAFAYNPAAMSFHDGKSLSLGVNHISYDLDVTTASGTFSTAGEDTFLVPNLFFMAKGYDRLSFGLAINAPFGLETSWPNGTFPGFASIGAGGAEPALSKIEMVNTNPNIAYKIDDSSSMAAGINYYNLRELAFNSQAATINGRGNGFGLRLAYLKQVGNLNIGLSYSSSVNLDLTGSSDLSAFGYPAMAVNASVELPSILQAGLAYNINNNLTIELDVEQTGWSSFDKIEITNTAGTVLTSSTNNWEDVTAYRLGVIYDLSDSTRLLFGYSDDPTPQELENFSARIPGNDRTLFSLGLAHQVDKGLRVEGSIMQVDFDERVVASTTPYAGTEPNGTTAYDGTYNSSVNLVSLGLTLSF